MIIQIRAEDVMTETVDIVDPRESAQKVARTLRDGPVGAVLVGEEPRGIITQTDIVDLLATETDTNQVTAADIMSSPLETIRADATIETVARKMDRKGIKRLAVTEDGIVGIVTTKSVSNYVPRLVLGIPEENHDLDPHLGVTYEEEDWKLEYVDGAEEETINIGDTVRFTKRIDEADVRAFAQASGDTNRLHLDESFASKTEFGKPIVHGVLTLGLISSALARIPGLTIYLSQDVSFREAIPVGETVTAMCEFVEDLGQNRYRLATRVYGEEGTVAVDGTATVLLQELPD
ncbi:CBS domain-containing protein [Natronoarchaeum sp. GCM10025703]|uniref:CBS domain-containing protein n=1 Tax=unclassified Natronoarchaeum TaxID=2620183 RepID=UPI00361A999F